MSLVVPRPSSMAWHCIKCPVKNWRARKTAADSRLTTPAPLLGRREQGTGIGAGAGAGGRTYFVPTTAGLVRASLVSTHGSSHPKLRLLLSSQAGSIHIHTHIHTHITHTHHTYTSAIRTVPDTEGSSALQTTVLHHVATCHAVSDATDKAIECQSPPHAPPSPRGLPAAPGSIHTLRRHLPTRCIFKALALHSASRPVGIESVPSPSVLPHSSLSPSFPWADRPHPCPQHGCAKHRMQRQWGPPSTDISLSLPAHTFGTLSDLP